MLLILQIVGTIFTLVFGILMLQPKRTPRLFIKREKMFFIALGITIISMFAMMIIDAPVMTYEEKVESQRYDSVGKIDYHIVGEKEMYSFFFSDGSETIKIEDSYYTVPNVKICNINAQKTTVYEQDIDERYVIEYTVYTHNKLVDGVWEDILLFGLKDGTTEDKVYEIYVPIGKSQYIYQNND